MSRMHKKFRSSKLAAALLLLCLLTVSGARASADWGDAPADLTISEFLTLQFRLSMERPESEALNSFSLVRFYPSSSPQSALVFVIQTWRDKQLQPSDLRREIRKFGEAVSGQFDAMVRHPLVSKRWRVAEPKANIVIKHVRYSDLRETLAVTIRGETLFDENSISKAKAEAIDRGAVWSW